ncbi:MAG: Carbon dioxide concentrating mechanism protein CcmL [Actinobacteria bacterium ADurb.Bin346]|nr:MAG: Carbon dioxide concentrating mechanism protein CcmL [Actinobacteria bacterium ADurb.Bin346]
MKMVKVIGSITSTIKLDHLKGFKLLLVQSVDWKLNGRKEYFVAVDTVGLGEEEIGLMVTGSTARRTDATRDKNIDGTLVAKVERVDLE